AIQFREKFVEQQTDDPDLQAEKAKAYVQLAHLTAETVSQQRAIELSEQARDMFTQLVHDHTGVLAYQAGLAVSYHDLGAFHNASGQTKKAEEAYRQALAIREQLAGAASADPDYRDALATTLLNLGLLYADTRRADQAEAMYRRAVD